MHNKAKLVLTLLMCLVLTFLFTVPRMYLFSTCDRMTELTLSASAALREEADCTAYLRKLQMEFERTAPVLRLFLDHDSVDALGAAIAVCTPLNEVPALLSGLNAVTAALVHLKGIETLKADSIF